MGTKRNWRALSLMAAVYLGIAESALAFAMDYAKTRVVRPENIAVAMDPTVQRHVGELTAHLDAAALILVDVQKDFCPGGALPIDNGDQIVPILNRWIEKATRLGIPVVAIAFFLGVQGLLARNPTGVQVGRSAAVPEDAIYGVVRITRHPFLWGVVIWSIFHLAANGDEASVVFFGTFFLLALFGTTLIDAKRRRKMGAGVPLGRNSPIQKSAVKSLTPCSCAVGTLGRLRARSLVNSASAFSSLLSICCSVVPTVEHW